MANVITRAQFAKQLVPGLNTIFGTGYKSIDNEHTPLFDIEKSDRSFEEEVLMTGFGTAPTVYSRLAELEKAGWIKYTPDPRDGRAKQVLLTTLARRTYAKMSSEAQKLAVGHKA